MLWISTASQKLDERIYQVYLWVKKYHEDSIHRVVYTVNLTTGRHSPDEDQVRAELLCGNYFLLRKENKVVDLPDGRGLSWQAFTPAVQAVLMNRNVPELLVPLAEYIHMRWHGVTLVPMTGTIRNSAIENSFDWVEVPMKYFWRNEVVETVNGAIQVTQKALVRFGKLAKHDDNASAIRMLRKRLNSEFLHEHPLSEDELRHKQEKFETQEVKLMFHAHYPSQKMLLARFSGQEWLMVDAFLHHHTKPKNKNKPKPKTTPRNMTKEGERNGAGNYGVHRVVIIPGRVLDK